MNIRTCILLFLTLNIYSIGSGQVCPGPLNITIDGSDTGLPLSLDYIHTNIYCNEDNGAIDVTILGGTPGYQCMWSTGDTLPSVHNLAPGTYSLTVSDATDCTREIEVVISDADPSLSYIVLADDNGCGKCSLVDSTSSYIYLGAEYMVQVIDLYDLEDLGEIEACIEIAETHLIHQDKPLLKRSWTFETTTNKGGLNLFFTKDELWDLMEKAGYDDFYQLVPSKLSIAKFDGGEHRPGNYETVEYQHNVRIYEFDLDEDVYYIEVPNILFKRGEPTSLHLELVPKIISSVEPTLDLNTELEFYLVQNPVTTKIHLATETEDHIGVGQIIVYNKLGQKVIADDFNKEILDGKTYLVEDLSPGVYFFVIQYKDRPFSQTLKFIKV